MPPLDLDAYLSRIGYAGPRAASAAVLRDLHRCHALSIPFENLDVLAGRRISIQPGDVERKLVRERRGGYCFEHSTLMLHALRALGFEVEPLIGRVRWQVPAEVVTNLGHMRLRARVEGRDFLADAGLGAVTLAEPILLECDTVQATSLDRRRLLRQGAEVLEQVSFGGSWLDVCIFSERPAPLPDFELGNWYYCTHPESLFVRNLVVARPGKDGRASLFNHDFVVRRTDGHTLRETIQTPERLRAVLQEFFDLDCPDPRGLACPGLRWET